jgi:hypothetical protein
VLQHTTNQLPQNPRQLHSNRTSPAPLIQPENACPVGTSVNSNFRLNTCSHKADDPRIQRYTFVSHVDKWNQEYEQHQLNKKQEERNKF